MSKFCICFLFFASFCHIVIDNMQSHNWYIWLLYGNKMGILKYFAIVVSQSKLRNPILMKRTCNLIIIGHYTCKIRYICWYDSNIWLETYDGRTKYCCITCEFIKQDTKCTVHGHLNISIRLTNVTRSIVRTAPTYSHVISSNKI